MRAIDADELLKVTVKRNSIWNAITNSSGEGLEEIINSQPTIEIPGWIPVTERLPEKNVEVLVTTDLGYVTIAELLEYDHWFICEGSYNALTEELTAWMPLPESYKEGNEE